MANTAKLCIDAKKEKPKWVHRPQNTECVDTHFVICTSIA